MSPFPRITVPGPASPAIPDTGRPFPRASSYGDGGQVRTATGQCPALPGQVPGLKPLCPQHTSCSVRATAPLVRGWDRPTVAIDDPPGHHLPERLPVLGFSFHGCAQQDSVLNDPLAIWGEIRRRPSVPGGTPTVVEEMDVSPPPHVHAHACANTHTHAYTRAHTCSCTHANIHTIPWACAVWQDGGNEEMGVNGPQDREYTHRLH